MLDLDVLKNKKCMICQSSLRLLMNDCYNDFIALCECALFGRLHYQMFLMKNLEIEEQIILSLHNHEYQIIQYSNPGCHIIITQFDENKQYVSSTNLDFSTPPFDFLNDDLNKNINRLKIILTFQ